MVSKVAAGGELGKYEANPHFEGRKRNQMENSSSASKVRMACLPLWSLIFSKFRLGFDTIIDEYK
jgi:hypothetical protein